MDVLCKAAPEMPPVKRETVFSRCHEHYKTGLVFIVMTPSTFFVFFWFLLSDKFNVLMDNFSLKVKFCKKIVLYLFICAL